jgi:hypothetical protein
VNAAACGVNGGRAVALPNFHSISGNRGGGRSVPLGGYWSTGPWSGAAVGVIQQLDRALRVPTFGFECCTPVSERSANNEYLAGALARDLGRGVTLGGALSYGGLGAMDGVDLLYVGADTIHQDGSLLSLRLGLTKESSNGRTFELLVLQTRAAMRGRRQAVSRKASAGVVKSRGEFVQGRFCEAPVDLATTWRSCRVAPLAHSPAYPLTRFGSRSPAHACPLAIGRSPSLSGT